MRTMLTQSLAVLMPFNVQELNDGNGCYYGINQVSKNINIGNRKKLINGNGFVFGVPGSGKSFFCKMEMGNVFLGTKDEIIVIDPMNEYFDIAHTYNGTVVNMSTYTDNYVNPLDMDVWSLDLNDSKGMIREKGEFMLGLCEQCMGENLNSRQKSIIDRCVRKLYIEIAKETPNKFGGEKYVPVMSDFYDILMNQLEEEAKDIALSLELFVNGSLNIFNHQTNVDVDNRFTVYGIRDLGTELSPITMLVMMESIQKRIIENGKRGVATWLYIDEFHVLLNSEYSAKYLQQLWKKVRKQGGLCTGITQNVVDKDCFEMEIDIANVKETNNPEFAMALFEYAPCDNWSGFYEGDYFLEFDAVSGGDIKAFQLEIKDDIRNKILDKTMNVSNKGEHFQIYLPSVTRDKTAWKKISQICFTVFFNEFYISGMQGTLGIKNLKMIPKR